MPRPTLHQTRTINTTQPLGFWRQIFFALSSTVGVGVFVGMGIAIAGAGAGIIGAVTLAALLALVNQSVFVGSVAPEAAESPFIASDWQHFTANWTLFLARLTAVATVALGVAGYLMTGLQLTEPIWLMLMALAVLVALTIISFRSLAPRRGMQTTIILTLAALLGLIFAGLPGSIHLNLQNLRSQYGVNSFWSFASFADLLQAAALMSVAYASEPNSSSIGTVNASLTPKVYRFALVLAWLLYLGVAVVSLSTQLSLGSEVVLNETTAWVAPLSHVIQTLPLPGGVYLITLGAVAGMTGVAMRLLPQLADGVLELNRSPTLLSTLLSPGQPSEMRLSPWLAKLLISIALGCIVLVGDVKTIWSFSAFAFLLSTALMHWIALRQSAFHPRWHHWLGLTSCLFLAFWVNWDVWLVSLGLVALALIWRGVQYWSEEP